MVTAANEPLDLLGELESRADPRRKHGSLKTYSKHRCRCEECLASWRDYQRDYIREWRKTHKESRNTEAPVTHGRITSYQKLRCRCKQCTAVWREYATFRNRWSRKQLHVAPEERQKCPAPSVCPICNRNFMTARNAKFCSSQCRGRGTYKARRERQYGREYDWKRSRETLKAEADRLIEQALAGKPELKDLLSEQERDDRFSFYSGRRWELSLDSTLFGDLSFYDVIGLAANWVDVIHHKIDRAREIDSWVDA